ncbi:uncharacterized protein ACNLHF_015608 [Anomaloglossus baeobatrachus]|uniref:uncharacterized protein LOC142302079 n=1 Tax=Anomaloglossus baeobatrachus TaxID=238106 RepID=UPI003F4FFF2D
MSSSVRPEDPENPKSPLPRCRCLDYCLVISLVLLTMVMGSICAFYMAWERQHLVSTAEAQLKMDLQESSAQLLVDDARLNNGILNWTMSRLSDHFVGQYFEQKEQKLEIKNPGFYSIFSQITLKCMDDIKCKNEEGEVSLTILNNIDPEETLLKLFIIIKKSTTITQPASFSKIIRHLRSGDKITAQLKVSKGIENWQFDREHSVLGLSWISDYSRDSTHE